MYIKFAAILILAVFYSFYIAKIIVQKKQSIKTNQMGVGNKPKRVLVIERIMSVATVTVILIEVGSIIITKAPLSIVQATIGIVLGIAAILFFALATITMRNSWRIGIPEEMTALVTNGIYKYSRNPAFVGFDLLYLSICVMYFNIPLIIASVWAAVMLHLQILQEEAHMLNMFGDAYADYTKHTMRYLGRR